MSTIGIETKSPHYLKFLWRKPSKVSSAPKELFHSPLISAEKVSELVVWATLGDDNFFMGKAWKIDDRLARNDSAETNLHPSKICPLQDSCCSSFRLSDISTQLQPAALEAAYCPLSTSFKNYPIIGSVYLQFFTDERFVVIHFIFESPALKPFYLGSSGKACNASQFF